MHAHDLHRLRPGYECGMSGRQPLTEPDAVPRFSVAARARPAYNISALGEVVVFSSVATQRDNFALAALQRNKHKRADKSVGAAS